MASLTHDSPELASAYERLSDTQFESGKRLAGRLGVKAGDRVLDVGCGTGRLARWIAEIVGPGSVVGVDPLPDRIAVARAHAPEIFFRSGHAEDLSAFADETFDVVCMSSVFHWVREKEKALAECRRVLRPRGRLGLTTLPKELRLAGTVAQVCAPIFGREPYASHVDPQLVAETWLGSTVTELITLVLGAKLALVEVHVARRARTHPSGDAVVDFLEASSFGNFLRMVPPELRASLRADVAAALDARKSAAGVVLDDHGMVLVAERP